MSWEILGKTRALSVPQFLQLRMRVRPDELDASPAYVISLGDELSLLYLWGFGGSEVAPMGRGPTHKTFGWRPGRTEARTPSAKCCPKERELREAPYDFFPPEFQILGVQSFSVQVWLMIQRLEAKPEHGCVRGRQHV